ncbi:tRNA lysidine(34) synthetase TilS [Rubrivivax gelatinosus]|nr:tRNA lysidine(34) synthetase TilS [Rubrivivax gelatinosus]
MPAAVAVAASGGRDSTALLHATARAARALGIQVHALHVHHGLVPSADAWLEHLRAQCARWARAGLPLHFNATRLSGAPARGDSVEAWARRERYAALASMAKQAGCGLVLLAQHRRDQAETLLLQALRGGGLQALAAMPARAERDGIVWARPWLEQPREAIEAYLRRHRLRWVDDESNDDGAYARNRLRHAVWPALVAAFPDAEAQLAAAARRSAEDAAALQAGVEADLASLADADGLDIAAWADLPAARRAAALRGWLRALLPQPVPDTLVRRLVAELPEAQAARWPAPGGELRLHDGRLRFAASVPETPLTGESTLDLSHAGCHHLPGWGGCLDVVAVGEGGVAAARLRCATLRPRRGGEQFQLGPRTLPRCLKKQYQARRIPAWARGGPLVFDDGQLLFAPGLGLDARCIAPPGEPQFTLHWHADVG